MVSKHIKSTLAAVYVLVGLYLAAGLLMFYFDPNPKPLWALFLLPLIPLVGVPYMLLGTGGVIIECIGIGFFLYLIIQKKYIASVSMLIAFILLIATLIFIPTPMEKTPDGKAVPHGFPIPWMTQDQSDHRWEMQKVWYVGEYPTTVSILPLTGSYLILFTGVFGTLSLCKITLRQFRTKLSQSSKV